MKTDRIYHKIKERHAGSNTQKDDLPGYPAYSEDEDIFVKGREEGEIDPENIYGVKETVYDDDLDPDEAGMNLDIPGAELDDDLEEIGSEDEENNFYSLSDNDDLEDLI